jgi:hypothetical protein
MVNTSTTGRRVELVPPVLTVRPVEEVMLSPVPLVPTPVGVSQLALCVQLVITAVVALSRLAQLVNTLLKARLPAALAKAATIVTTPAKCTLAQPVICVMRM